MWHQRVMVQIAEPDWTQEALYRACILARKGGGEVALVQMVPVQQLALLGTDFGLMNMTIEAQQALENYLATAEDYGVSVTAHLFQYFALTDAIIEAAEQVQADVVFATLPQYWLPFWRQYQINYLRQQLTRQQRVLWDRDCLLATDRTGRSVPAR